MARLTIADLHTIKKRVNTENLMRTPQEPPEAKKHRLDTTGSYRAHILVCGGTGCKASRSETIYHGLLQEVKERGLTREIKVVETGCNGFCAAGPIMVVYPGGIFYQKIKAEDIGEIITEHMLNGNPIERLMFREPVTGKVIPHMRDIPFFGKQQAIALKNRSLIDAEHIDEYIGNSGYLGAAKTLTELTPDQVIDEVKKSGLRGRGGAGFPTGIKWSFARKAKGDTKYVLCNADEGDPGAFMDRSILENDPHSVLEGMIIGGYAIGASQGYIYCRAEYPLAVKRLSIAINQAKEYGLLGANILGTAYSLDIHIYQGAGAFVCGEETALMASIEGRRGMPRPRPPFPANQGLWDKPSVLNNVETYACIPQIILQGGSWFAAIGTERSKGTKVFALTGDVMNVGLVEVPMGTSVREIIFDIGGGIPDGKKIKAAQLGGPSGGCLPENTLDTPIDYEEITKLGAIMGSGGLIVMDENSCMVDSARFFMEFCQEESCGKCTPCREGTKRMLEILTRICKGKGKEGDIQLLEEMAPYVKESALCGLGQTSPNPVLTTLRYFRDEYEAHIHQKKCSAGTCTALVAYAIDPETCIGCGLCARKCPQQCITGEKKKPHVIDTEACIKCGVCKDVCKFDAVKYV